MLRVHVYEQKGGARCCERCRMEWGLVGMNRRLAGSAVTRCAVCTVHASQPRPTLPCPGRLPSQAVQGSLAAPHVQTRGAAALSVAGHAGLPPLWRTARHAINPPRASPSLSPHSCLHPPWCAACVQDHYLHSFFTAAISLGQQALASGGVLQGADRGVCRAAIALLSQCMQWEFRRPGLPSVLAGVGAGGGAGWLGGMSGVAAPRAPAGWDRWRRAGDGESHHHACVCLGACVFCVIECVCVYVCVCVCARERASRALGCVECAVGICVCVLGALLCFSGIRMCMQLSWQPWPSYCEAMLSPPPFLPLPLPGLASLRTMS